MAEQQLVKSIYTAADVTSLGEFATTDTFPIANAPAGLARTASPTFTGNATFVETTDTVYGITDGAAFEIDPSNGNVQTITLTASRTPKATNFTAGQCILLGIDDGASAYAITWTDATLNPVWVSSAGSGTAPTLAASGYTWVLLWKVASQMYAAFVGKP